MRYETSYVSVTSDQVFIQAGEQRNFIFGHKIFLLREAVEDETRPSIVIHGPIMIIRIG